jgi:hypothetical protein
MDESIQDFFKPKPIQFRKVTTTDEIKTQRDAVVYHLLIFHGITSREAFTEWGITRLSSIIHNLRHNEFLEIETEDITSKNRFGHPVTFAKYKLTKNPINNVYTQQEFAL